MPAVKISVRLKLDENIERTNWCPSISGWTLTNYVVPERDRERLAIFQEFEFGFGHLMLLHSLSAIISRPLCSAVPWVKT